LSQSKSKGLLKVFFHELTLFFRKNTHDQDIGQTYESYKRKSGEEGADTYYYLLE